MWSSAEPIVPHSLDDRLALSDKPAAVFYSQDGLLDSARWGKLDFVNQLREVFREAGFDCHLVNSSSLAGPINTRPGDYCIWALERQPVRPVEGDVFHVFPSYLHGFWYFDSMGVRNNSSIKSLKFTLEK